MDSILLRIAFKIASEGQIGYSAEVLKTITNEMRDDFNVSPDQEPFKEGERSVVYINRDDNIVSFSPSRTAYGIAEHLLKQKADILPEVYKVKSYGNIYGIEMERLSRSLTEDEKIIFDTQCDELIEKMEPSFFGAADRKNYEKRLEEDAAFSQLNEEVSKKMEELGDKAAAANIQHEDLHGENVMWDRDGNLKFIDLESVNLKDHGLYF
jgi:hypothetical protein